MLALGDNDASGGGNLGLAVAEESDELGRPRVRRIMTPFGPQTPGLALCSLLGVKGWSQGGTAQGRLDRVRRSADLAAPSAAAREAGASEAAAAAAAAAA